MPKPRRRYKLTDLDRFILEKQRLELLATQLDFEEQKLRLEKLKKYEKIQRKIHKRHKHNPFSV